MELQEIERLLEAYLAGKTSLEEEARLRNYLLHKERLPDHLREYKALFGFFEAEKERTFENDLLLPKPKNYKRYVVVASIVAIVAVLLMVNPFSVSKEASSVENQVSNQNAKGLFMIMGGAVQESKENLRYFNELDTLQSLDNRDKPKEAKK